MSPAETNAISPPSGDMLGSEYDGIALGAAAACAPERCRASDPPGTAAIAADAARMIREGNDMAAESGGFGAGDKGGEAIMHRQLVLRYPAMGRHDAKAARR